MLRIDTDGLQPGYARQINESNNQFITREDAALRIQNLPVEIHGPANREFMVSMPTNVVKKYEYNHEPNFLDDKETMADFVPVVHSPYLPTHVQEWVRRSRPNNCPSGKVNKKGRNGRM